MPKPKTGGWVTLDRSELIEHYKANQDTTRGSTSTKADKRRVELLMELEEKRLDKELQESWGIM